MRIVIDASVAVKWFLWSVQDEPHFEAALSILDAVEAGTLRAIAPIHWKVEVISVVTRSTQIAVPQILSLMQDTASLFVDEARLYERAASLSLKYKQHLFDSLYHAVAIEHGATLITADERYYAAASVAGSIVRLRDFKTS